MAIDRVEGEGRWDWAQQQAELFETTGGKEGGTFEGFPIMVLTTTGAKSGQPRKTPLMLVELDDSYIAAASKGGAASNPAWYVNLTNNARVKLQVGELVMECLATTLEGKERDAAWQRAVETYPSYAVYAERTDRTIPVVKLTPTS